MKISAPLLVVDARCELGENPLWHPQRQTLYFLDIPAGSIHAYDPRTGESRLFSKGRPTGGMLMDNEGRLLLFQDGAVSLAEEDGKQRLLADGLCPGNDRFNDVIADPRGRVFAGTVGGNGKLLRFDLNGSVTQILEGRGVPNGMGFSPDLSRMYFTDSAQRKVYVFDYDERTGNVTNQRDYITIPADRGAPDGMCVDAEGFVWTAVWFGGRVQRFAPDGTYVGEIRFPVYQTSAVTFGGADLADIYVTSARTNLADAMRPAGFDLTQPRGGGLYRTVVSGIRGRQPFAARIAFPKSSRM